MPAMIPAAVGASAIGTGAAIGAGVGGLGALGTGLAAGAAIGGAGGIAGLMGGLGGAGALAPGAFGALAPGVASTIAPAAASQLAGTIGTAAGSVAPGLTGSAAQNLGLNALKSQVIGTGVQNAAAQQATNLAFQNAAAQNMAGGLANPMTQMAGAYNPATAETLSAKFLANSPYPVANPNNLNFLNSSVANTNNTAMPLETLNSFPPFKQGLDPSALQRVSLSNPTAQAVNPADIMGRSIRPNQNFLQNLGNIGSFQDAKDYANQHPYATSAIAGLGIMGARKLFEQDGVKKPESNAMIRPYTYDRSQRPEAYAISPTEDSSERLYFNDQFNAGEPYKVAGGGIVSLAVGGPVEQMAAMNSIGANTGYPMANLQTPMYSNPAMQRPEATNVIAPSADAGVGAYSGEARFAGGGETQYGVSSNPNYVNPENQTRSQLAGGRRPTAPTAPLPKYSYDPKTMQFTQTVGGNSVTGGIATPTMGAMQAQPQRPATSINIPAYQTPEQQLGLGGFYDYMNQQLGGYGGYAKGGNVGGISHLGDYSDGGRLLKGPGDGVSDSIPASIGDRQPARLADGEFVVPARIVSELGNGSTEAGARKLYAMMERVQKGRGKSVGKGKVAVNSKADKYLPA